MKPTVLTEYLYGLLPDSLVGMSTASKVYAGRLDGLTVLGPSGESLGKVVDSVVLLGTSASAPRVVGLIVQLLNRRRVFVPMLRVAAIENTAVSLVSGSVTIQSFQARAGEKLVLGELLDRRVTVPDSQSSEPTEMAIVDIEFERTRTRDWVVSRVAVRKPSGRFSRRGPVLTVPYRDISGLVDDTVSSREQDAAALAERFEGMRPADVAAAIRELPEQRRHQLAAALDDERLADVIQELPHEDGAEFVAALNAERAADLLEAMDPDDAADLLGEFTDTEASAFLELMNPEDAAPVRRLLTFSPDTAGGFMSPEPVLITPQTTVAEALALCRNPDLTPAMASMVFVARPPTSTPSGHYLGVVHLQRLLREPPATLVSEYLDTDLPSLRPDDSTEQVARFLATYNLVCAPVVDDERHLLGVVSIDDLLDHLLPENWREEVWDGPDTSAAAMAQPSTSASRENRP